MPQPSPGNPETGWWRPAANPRYQDRHGHYGEGRDTPIEMDQTV